MFTVMVLLSRSTCALLLETAFFLIMVLAFNLSTRWARSFRLFGSMILLVFIISLVAFDVHIAFTLSLRLHNLFIVSFLFFQTLSPEETAAALLALRTPYPFVFVLLGAVRYVPLLGQKIRNIRDAQVARGIDVRPRITNLSRFMALVIPLLFQSFILSEHLAMAMESRGFSRPGRTRAIRLKFGIRDVLACLGLVVICWALLWWDHKEPRCLFP